MTARTSEAAAASRPAAARIVFGTDQVGVDEVVAIAFGLAEPVISDEPAFVARLEAGRTVLERCLSAGEPVYGVSTGVGASVENDVPGHLQAELARNLFRFHGCGTGRILDAAEAS